MVTTTMTRYLDVLSSVILQTFLFVMALVIGDAGLCSIPGVMWFFCFVGCPAVGENSKSSGH